MAPFNIAQFLPDRARSSPDRAAVICPHAPDGWGRTALTFSELNAECDALAWGLSNAGIAPGCRTLLAVRPGLDFVALTFALFKLGAVPVLIDPGMGRAKVLHCVARARPEALIAIPAAHALRALTRHSAFDALRVSVTVGRRWFWGGTTLKKIREQGAARGVFPMTKTFGDTLAAILFTSGGTGLPKGVCYEHGMFGAQVEAIGRHFQVAPGEIDMPAFPLFALFSTALGTTCIIPDMNPSRPAQCDPDTLIDTLKSRSVTYSFGSPAIWKRVGPRCLERGEKLPDLKRILMAGAPVRGEVLAPFAKILSSDADVFIPYGATEALPVSSIRGSEVLRETWDLTRRGKGYCLGHPLPGMKVKIVPVERKSGLREPSCRLACVTGEVGEIVVSGPVVTKEYFEMPDETAKAKIIEAGGCLWHRMGDMGYFDARGRLWFCGRKAHRVIAPNGCALYSVCCEALFEEFLHTKFNVAARGALARIGGGDETKPVLILETTRQIAAPGVQSDIVKLWKQEPLSKEIGIVLFYSKPFPVDVRHNAKIDREALGRWAAKKQRHD